MTTIYIDSNLTPRYSPNGWPDINQWHPGHGMKQDYLDALQKAKDDSVPFENVEMVFKAFGKFKMPLDSKSCCVNSNVCQGMDRCMQERPDVLPDTFIDVEIGEVEIGFQWRPSPNAAWQDTNEAYWININPNITDKRKVARVKKQGNAAMGYTEGSDLGYHVWSKEKKDLQVVSADEVIKRLSEQLDAANKKTEEIDRIVSTDKYHLRENILHGFRKEYHADITRHKRAMDALERVLDELKIK